MGNLPAAAPMSATGTRKAWHEHVTQDLRSHLVHKLYVPWSETLLSRILVSIPVVNIFLVTLQNVIVENCVSVPGYKPYSLPRIQQLWRTEEWRTLLHMPGKWKGICTSRPTVVYVYKTVTTTVQLNWNLLKDTQILFCYFPTWVLFFPSSRMNTIIFWLRKSIRSKRNWRRSGALGYRSR